jgi:nickel-dependent lactate racemase
MMHVDLAYGKGSLTIEVPNDRSTVIEPSHLPGLPDVRAALVSALRNPIGTPPLRRLVGSGQTVAISVCDITRPMPSSTLLPVLLAELSHVPNDQITILVATGTHRANTRAELEEMLGPEVVRDYEIINHDGFDESTLAPLGETSDGVPVHINRRFLEADVRITTGFVEPHFFAGFSGGPKMVAPGLAGFSTIMGLHGADLIAHANSTWGITEGNPIHDEIRSIAARAEVDFNVDVTINREREITTAYAGELSAVHRAACQVARRTAMSPVTEPFDVVVTTNSGYPLDLNLYQSVKGMSAAAQIVKRGGTIICAAECSDGIPEHGEYGRLLASRNSPADLLEMITAQGFASHDQWQVQLQAQIQLRAEVHLKSSFLSEEQVRAAHLEPVEDLNATVLESLERHGPHARLCVLPQGPQTIPYLEIGS